MMNMGVLMRDHKIDTALTTFAQGYNCAQSVFSTFAADFGMDAATAMKISSCFGGGMRMGATCGALSGALMVLGLAKGFSEYSPEQKAAIEEHCYCFIGKWKERFKVTDCKEILGIDVSDPAQRLRGREQGVFDRHCPHCIETAVRLLCDVLEL